MRTLDQDTRHELSRLRIRVRELEGRIRAALRTPELATQILQHAFPPDNAPEPVDNYELNQGDHDE